MGLSMGSRKKPYWANRPNKPADPLPPQTLGYIKPPPPPPRLIIQFN